MYLLLSAEFVAAAQVLVYAGAVIVMFLFVIAYVGPRHETPWSGGPSWQTVGAVRGGRRAARRDRRRRRDAGERRASRTETSVGTDFGSPGWIGRVFLTDHLLAFEITSIVLLVAAVGGVILGAHTPEGDLMDGPNVAWYIALAAVLFGIGALGVLIRRNTLIVLLSLELMLNAGNLALIAFSRHFAQRRGPDLRAHRDGGRRLGGLRRARPRRRAQPAEPLARRRHALGAARMTGGRAGSACSRRSSARS